ncbi:MAG TPA: DUF2339 domain-containing protein [Silvibacterium sp.]|jgi:uncharacterized membrane protein|nr:DUF2339 domain-containing protein [Silvibacterium sp.]
MDVNPSDNLAQQIADLRSRVVRLEAALRTHGIVLEEDSPLTPVSQVQATEASTMLVPAPSVAPTAAHPVVESHEAPAKEDRSLESRIGSQWFNRIGILAVLIGMAWFLKLAIDNHWIGPLGRVIIGLISGAGLIAWSERFRSRGYAAFSYSLKAVGSGILYLSLWAAFALFQLVPSSVAFAAMILVTAFNGFMCWAQDSELLALYAIIGGFSTPLLLSTGENHEVTLFSYLLLLNVAVFLLVALRPWSRLLFGAFLGTIFLFVGWWIRFYSGEQFALTAFFLAIFFLIFAFAPRLVRLPGSEEDVTLSRADSLTIILLPLLNAVLGFLGFYTLLDSSGGTWAQPWVAVAFAAFYLLLLRLPNRGALHGSPSALSALHLTIAVLFLTIAIPMKAHGRWLTIGWLVEGAALLWLSRSMQSRLLRGLALLALALGLGALVVVNPRASTAILFNQRFGTYLVGILVFAFTARLAYGAVEDAELEFPFSWRVTAAAAVLAVNVLILLAIGWEIHNYWWFVRYSGDWSVMHEYRMYAQFTYSAFFMIFGAALLAVGFWKRSAFLRWQALVLLAVSIGKVFLIDVSQLSQGYRIVSFLGLGALLLGVSFVYQKDLLNLRGSERAQS